MRTHRSALPSAWRSPPTYQQGGVAEEVKEEAKRDAVSYQLDCATTATGLSCRVDIVFQPLELERFVGHLRSLIQSAEEDSFFRKTHAFNGPLFLAVKFSPKSILVHAMFGRYVVNRIDVAKDCVCLLYKRP